MDPQPPTTPPQPTSPQPPQPEPAPSYAVQPSTFPQPASPPPAQPFPQPAPASFTPEPQKSHKGLIIGIVAGIVGLIVLGIIGVVLYMTLVVTAADYNSASDQMSDIKKEYNKFDSVYISSSSTTSEIENGADTLKDARTEFEAALAELGEMKAIKRDNELATQYAAVLTKKKDFDTAMDAALETYEKILPALSSYTRSSSSTGSSALEGMITTLEGIDGLESDINKDFIENITAKFKRLVVLLEKVEAGRADYRKYDSSAVNEYFKTSTDISTIVRDWQSDIKKLADDGEINDELNDLSDLLQKKSIGS